jgi:glycine/D-amino acid oxidase-like deaminating enzyme
VATSRNGAILRYHLRDPYAKSGCTRVPDTQSAEAEAWRDLHRQLARTRTLQDAKDIAAQAAPPHAKRFYAHLRSFVRTLKSPRRGTRSELHVYGKLRLRFANGRQPGA